MEAKTPAPLGRRILAWLFIPWLLAGSMFCLALIYLGVAWLTGNLERPVTAAALQDAIRVGSGTVALTLLVLFCAIMVWGSIERIREMRKEHRATLTRLEQYSRSLDFSREQAQHTREALLHAVTVMRALSEEAAERGARPLPSLQVDEDELGEIRRVRREPDPSRRPARQVRV